MPSDRAVKPGDVYTAMNGKTVEVDNTDAEGRLILADALYYVQKTYDPLYTIDVATLTGAMVRKAREKNIFVLFSVDVFNICLILIVFRL